MVSSRAWLSIPIVAALLGCAASPQTGPKSSAQATPSTGPHETYSHDPYPSTYKAYPGVLTAITGGTVFDGEGKRFENGTVILADGKVEAVGGADTPVP